MPLFDASEAETPRAMKRPRPAPPSDEDFSRQRLLFEERVLMIGELERALQSADYRAALACKDKLEQTYGAGAVPPRLCYLERLGADFWDRPLSPGERLSGWRTIARELDGSGQCFRRARHAFFRRSLTIESPEALIRCDAACVVPIAKTLYEVEDVSSGRRVVRDALLLGYDIRPFDLQDEMLSDLLSEDLAPRWLASLGAIRRLWPLPRPGAREIATFEGETPDWSSLGDDERALSFWRCLSVARVARPANERLLQDARKRMKRLNPDLHAAYMGTLVAR
jgi:hypothetical protein